MRGNRIGSHLKIDRKFIKGIWTSVSNSGRLPCPWIASGRKQVTAGRVPKHENAKWN